MSQKIDAKTISIDMSTNDEDAENRIFGKVVEQVGNNILCEFESANYDFKQKETVKNLNQQLKAANQKIKELQEKIDKLITCVEFYSDEEFLIVKKDYEGDLRVYEVDDGGEEAICGTMAIQTLKEIGYLKES